MERALTAVTPDGYELSNIYRDYLQYRPAFGH